MNLLMIRHGESPSNLKKVYAGRNTERLTERGIAQAKEVAERLRCYKVYSLYSSPIERAIQTAKIIGEIIGLEPIIEEAFQEMDLGPWEGLSEKDIARLYPKEWKLWQSKPAELKLPDREMLKEVMERALSGIKKIQKVVGDKTIIVVTHIAIIRTLLLWYAKKDLNLYKTIHVANGKVFKIKIDPYRIK